jgi:uncharacterized protein (TIGR03435 family)
MHDLARLLSFDLEQPVRDLTGLEGVYPIDFTTTLPLNLALLRESMTEQLGIGIERKTVMTEVLVITGVERPALDD